MISRGKIIKQKREQQVFSIILGLFFLILTCLLFFSNWKISQKRKDLLANVAKLRFRIEAMQAEGEELEENVLESGTEDYLEEKVRGYGYKKPGESVIIIKKEDDLESAVFQPELQDNSDNNFWQIFMAKIRSFF